MRNQELGFADVINLIIEFMHQELHVPRVSAKIIQFTKSNTRINPEGESELPFSASLQALALNCRSCQANDSVWFCMHGRTLHLSCEQHVNHDREPVCGSTRQNVCQCDRESEIV